MKTRDLLVYHGLPLFLILFPFAWVGIVGNDHMLKGESGFVEITTALFLLAAIVVNIPSLAMTRRLNMSGYTRAWVVLMILGATYFMLEEISYGQHIFHWSTPEPLKELNDQGETNLHNISALFDQVPRTLLELAILVGGVIMPLYRHFRHIRLTESDRLYWQWPTMDCVTAGLIVTLLRPVFSVFETSTINTGETKEQLFGLFILLYCLSLHTRLRRKARTGSATEVAQAGQGDRIPQ
jgi:hypothetical protein